MKVLFVNPILYTSEAREINRISSIKDTMAYGLCDSFKKKGHDICLYTCSSYRPSETEEYDFPIIFDEPVLTSFLPVNKIVKLKNLKNHIKNNYYDMIISSECFQFTTLDSVKSAKGKTYIWQELAKHNRMMKKLPSRFWYSLVARAYFKNTVIIPRSKQARTFISKYCRNVSEINIGHGVYLEKFKPANKKEQLIVASQLIPRKRIHLILDEFCKFSKNRPSFTLKICGEGQEMDKLKNLSARLGISDKVIFMGKLQHNDLCKEIAQSFAMLIYTEQDNNMISITESLACCTPVITTDIPYNSSFIKENGCGIVGEWCADDLNTIVDNIDYYVSNCYRCREELSYEFKIQQFIEVYEKTKEVNNVVNN